MIFDLRAIGHFIWPEDRRRNGVGNEGGNWGTAVMGACYVGFPKRIFIFIAF